LQAWRGEQRVKSVEARISFSQSQGEQTQRGRERGRQQHVHCGGAGKADPSNRGGEHQTENLAAQPP
jgi:hypothetical protein